MGHRDGKASSTFSKTAKSLKKKSLMSFSDEEEIWCKTISLFVTTQLQQNRC